MSEYHHSIASAALESVSNLCDLVASPLKIPISIAWPGSCRLVFVSEISDATLLIAWSIDDRR
jgi:hypothetical protein